MVTFRKRRPGTAAIAVTVAVIALSMPARTEEAAPRTPNGKPDLQGVWLNNTATPLERLKDWAGKATLSDDEAREYEKRYQLDRTAALTRDTPEFELDAAGDLDTYEPGRLLPGNRTSLITDPADGRVPPLTPQAQRRLSEQSERLNGHFAEGPENFTNPERCLIVANTSAPPMLPAFYNNSVQLVQTRDYVLIASEMIHEARIVPLDKRTHLPTGIGQWRGDSIGHWEGDALIVDTTNFSDKTTLRGSGPGLHVVERFTLADANTLRYQFTVEEPASFARSWSGESAMTRTTDRVFEYACHEGNQSLPNTMRGARFLEHQGGTPQPASSPNK